MDLYLQFGWGMMAHCRTLVAEWGEGTVILSPRDLEPGQMQPFSDSITALPNGNVLLDPQFYLPQADHQRLGRHSFWPPNYATQQFWTGGGVRQLLDALLALNQSLGCRAFILPSCLAADVDADWLQMQRAFLDEALALHSPIPLIATVALSADALHSQDNVAALLEAAETWAGVEAFYVVAQHPNGQYLVEDPSWLANLLDVLAGLRLLPARVILGYANHQSLMAATAKVTAIASGTFMNVRSFPPDKFLEPYQDERRHPSTWYYAPRTLSEYKIPFLDIARQQGLLDLLAPPPTLMTYCGPLFSGIQPTLASFRDQQAFRHYLHCLRAQAAAASLSSFDETFAHQHTVLTEAETALQTLHARAIRCNPRDYLSCLDPSRAALGVLSATRGAVLRHRWNNL